MLSHPAGLRLRICSLVHMHSCCLAEAARKSQDARAMY